MAGQLATDVAGLAIRGGNADPRPSEDGKTAEPTVDPKAHGWVQPTGYDYEAYQAKGEPGQTTMKVPMWASEAIKYEWKDEYGEVGPEVPELEKELFRNEYILRRGEGYNNLVLEVKQESETQIKPIKEFDDAGLHPIMRRNIELCQYDHPTPIQAYCIPAVLQNHDVIAIAQTGSGKTASFLIPILSKLMGKAKKLAAPRPNPSQSFDPRINGVVAEPLVLIVAPTRELAVQIFDETRRLCYRSMLRPCVAYGGGPMRDQGDELRRGCDVLIGTPGRLIDFMSRGHMLSLRRVRYTVIDEADELVGTDWAEDMQQLLSGGDNNEDADHRYMLFSATFPKGARALAKEYLDSAHVRIAVGRMGSTHKNIAQQVLSVAEENKRGCLRDLLLNLKPTRTMIFVNSKKAADFLDDYLFNNGFPSTSIHSERTQREREDAIRAFRTSRAPILITTGVSARGLDISNVMHVINFDLPRVDHGGIEEYTHRIGRTARMGNRGLATSFFNERDEALAPALVRVLIENDQQVPDFLEAFKPAEGEPLDFEDNSDDEDAEGGGGGGWGSQPAPTETNEAGKQAEGWGGQPEPAQSNEAAKQTGASSGWDSGASGWGGGSAAASGGFGAAAEAAPAPGPAVSEMEW